MGDTILKIPPKIMLENQGDEPGPRSLLSPGRRRGQSDLRSAALLCHTQISKELWGKKHANSFVDHLRPSEVEAFALDISLRAFWELTREKDIDAQCSLSTKSTILLRQITLDIVEKYQQTLTQEYTFEIPDPAVVKQREEEKQEQLDASREQRQLKAEAAKKERAERAARMKEKRLAAKRKAEEEATKTTESTTVVTKAAAEEVKNEEQTKISTNETNSSTDQHVKEDSNISTIKPIQKIIPQSKITISKPLSESTERLKVTGKALSMPLTTNPSTSQSTSAITRGNSRLGKSSGFTMEKKSFVIQPPPKQKNDNKKQDSIAAFAARRGALAKGKTLSDLHASTPSTSDASSNVKTTDDNSSNSSSIPSISPTISSTASTGKNISISSSKKIITPVSGIKITPTINKSQSSEESQSPNSSETSTQEKTELSEKSPAISSSSSTTTSNDSKKIIISSGKKEIKIAPAFLQKKSVQISTPKTSESGDGASPKKNSLSPKMNSIRISPSMSMIERGKKKEKTFARPPMLTNAKVEELPIPKISIKQTLVNTEKLVPLLFDAVSDHFSTLCEQNNVENQLSSSNDNNDHQIIGSTNNYNNVINNNNHHSNNNNNNNHNCFPSIQNSLDFYHYSSKGPRPANEDEYTVIEHANEFLGIDKDKTNDKYSFFGAYDGHSGKYTSLFIRSQIHHKVFMNENFPNDFEKAIHNGILEIDSIVNQVQERDEFACGSTVLAAWIRNNEELIVGNVGDCRGFICRDGKTIEIADPHHPTRPDEKNRIESLGGAVVKRGAWRVNGILAVSRSIGDSNMKKFVIADPEITKFNLQPNDFVIIASDGLWDVVKPDEMLQIVQETCKTKGRKFVCQTLCDEALEKQSKDNVTVLAMFVNKSDDEKERKSSD